jgi:hypothetical protein
MNIGVQVVLQRCGAALLNFTYRGLAEETIIIIAVRAGRGGNIMAVLVY